MKTTPIDTTLEPRLAPRSTRPRNMAQQWLRLASYGAALEGNASLETRERVRRSRLAAWIILGMVIADLLVLLAGLSDPPTLVAVLVALVCFVVAVLLNRTGSTYLAAIVVVTVVTGGIFGAVIESGGLAMANLPAYDLLAATIVVGASILPRAAAFGIALFNVGAMVLDFALQPHAPDVQHAIATLGTIALLARPIGLQIIIAVVAYLWVRGTDDAIRRADRAEEVARLEHEIADQKRQLDAGIQQILQTHVRAANGDFSARAPLNHENVLWQIAASLNNMLARLQRAGQAEHRLQRTEEELRRLAAAIDDAQVGRHPIWPAPSGTAADLIIERVARARRPGGPPSAPVAHSTPVATNATREAVPSAPLPALRSLDAGEPSIRPRAEGSRSSRPLQVPPNPWAYPGEGDDA